MVPGALAAQGSGTRAGLLLEVPGTARALALAGAYVAVVGDEGSVFANPAGMAPVRLAVGGSFEEDFLGARLTTAAGVVRVRRFAFGLGGMLLDFGGDSVIVPDPSSGGERGLASGALIKAYNALAVGAIAYRRGMISVGANAKYLRESIDDGGSSAYVAHGVTGDVGIAIAVFDLMAFGAVVQNLAGSLTRSGSAPADLPRTTRAAFTLNFIDPQGTLRLMTTAEWVAPRGGGGESHWLVGLEGGAVAAGVGIVGRAGIELGGGEAASDRGSVTLGGGLVLRGLKLDFGYQGFGSTGAASHRVGVRWAH